MDKMRKPSSPADWMMSSKLDPSGSEISDFLLQLRTSNRALDRLRHALEGNEAEHRLARDASDLAS